jgi:hypothetical protein
MVQRFQGVERTVIMVSATESDRAYRTEELKRALEFRIASR